MSLRNLHCAGKQQTVSTTVKFDVFLRVNKCKLRLIDTLLLSTLSRSQKLDNMVISNQYSMCSQLVQSADLVKFCHRTYSMNLSALKTHSQQANTI